MPNVNIPGTENNKFVWTHKEKREEHLKKNDGLRGRSQLSTFSISTERIEGGEGA